jgi:hypothetical protein
VFLFVFSRDWVLVTEDKVDFIRASAFVGSEHDGIRCLIGEFLGMDTLWGLSKKLQISASTFQTVLELGFISTCQIHFCEDVLYDEGLSGVVDHRRKGGRNGMVCSGILDDESFLPDHALQNVGFLDGPLSDVAKLLLAGLYLLGGMGRRPPFRPIGCELFDKQSLDRGGLYVSNWLRSAYCERRQIDGFGGGWFWLRDVVL